jgi:peptide/nickel transport system ATP-binding protein
MYAGRIAEIGPVRDVIHAPRHPYSVGLMGSIPKIRQHATAGAERERRPRLVQIEGSMPRLNAIPPGCAFHPRCPKRFERCDRERPEPIAIGTNRTACWLYAERGE